jgi:parvulin-like peptidyl-prolyl isomerase
MAYGAAQEGITVSDEEVETYYKSLFAYYPDGTPTATATSEPFEATPTITDEQLAILRYTETPLPTDIPTEAPAEETAETDVTSEVVETVEEAADTVEEAVEKAEETVTEVVENAEEAVEEAAADAEAMADKTAEMVEEVLNEPTSEPTIAPTPTVYTEDMFKQYETVYFANNYYYSKDFFKNQLRYELLQNKVEDVLKADVARTADMVWARHILVEKEEEAKAALERINAGEEWGDVAAEVSTDSTASNGGDLGWFTQGKMVQAFNDAAFSQEVGTISEPVQTEFGWHLIQVIAHEEHPLTSSEYDTAVNEAYQAWLDSYTEKLDINLDGYKIDMVPTDPAFVG